MHCQTLIVIVIVIDHKHAVGVFMDINKSFDTIDHNLLHKKKTLWTTNIMGHCKQMDLLLFRK